MSLRNPAHKLFLIICACACVIVSRPARAGEWHVHEADMAGFQSKMQALEKEIQELVEKRKGTENLDDAKKINEDIAAKYADLKKTHDDYDAEKLHMRFQHPEKGDLAERKYPRYKLESLKKLETDLSLDGQLDRMRSKVRSVYDVQPIHKAVVEDDVAEPRSPASAPDDESRITLKK